LGDEEAAEVGVVVLEGPALGGEGNRMVGELVDSEVGEEAEGLVEGGYEGFRYGLAEGGRGDAEVGDEPEGVWGEGWGEALGELGDLFGGEAV